VYVNGFCQNRGLPTEGITLTQRVHTDPETRMIGRIELIIHVPASFPAKYHEALVRVAGQCAVKKHLEHPPAFETTVAVAQ
jgi:ribosomal protein S12 methylthiotransferase accessory factor